jgi:hypothetical protein
MSKKKSIGYDDITPEVSEDLAAGRNRKRSSRKRRSRASTGAPKRKRKLNAYFVKMLAAKRSGAPEFMYNGNRYVRMMRAIRPGATPVPLYKKA